MSSRNARFGFAVAIALAVGGAIGCQSVVKVVPATHEPGVPSTVNNPPARDPTKVGPQARDLAPASQQVLTAIAAVNDTTGTSWLKRVGQFYLVLVTVGLAIIAFLFWQIR
jgi:hypothetical protein